MKTYLPFIQKIAMLVLGIAIVVAGSYAMATGVWNAAPGNPPSGNTPSLIDTSVINQVKQGGDLAVGNNATSAFIANANASFGGDVYLHGMVRGGGINDVNSTLNIGSSSIAAGKRLVTSMVNTFISGGVSVAGSSAATIQSDSLVSGAASTPLCADTTGTIAACGPGVVTSGSSSTTTTVNPRHIPPININLVASDNIPVYGQPGRALLNDSTDPSQVDDSSGGTVTGTGVSVSASNPSLSAITIYVNIVNTSKAGTCNTSPVYAFQIPANSYQSDMLGFGPTCILSITVSSFNPDFTVDKRPVILGNSSVRVDPPFKFGQ